MKKSPVKLAAVVGGNVRTFREGNKLSQPALAERLADLLGRDSFPKQVVSKIELGRRSLSAEELIAMALALGVPVTELLTVGGSGDKDSQVELSPNWTMLRAELHAAVAGDAAAAAAMKVREELTLAIHNASHAHIAATVSIPTPTVRGTKPEPKKTKRTRRGGSR